MLRIFLRHTGRILHSNCLYKLGAIQKICIRHMGGRGSSPKCHKLSQTLPMGGRGSGGLCHMKVGDKNGREAAEFSKILHIFTSKMVIFSTKIQNFLPKNHKHFCYFLLLLKLKFFYKEFF